MPTDRAVRTSPWWLRLAVVFLGAATIWVGLGLLSDLAFGSGYSYASHAVRACATSVLVIALLFVVARWGGRSATTYGLLPDRSAPGNFGIGALGYLLPFAIAAVVVLSLGAATLSISGTPPEMVGQFAAVLALVLLYEAIPEELIFRGYIFTALDRRFPLWMAVVGQALLFCLFGVAIGAAQTPDRLLLFFLFSLSLGVVRAVTGSVFATIGFHAAFQLATQPVLGPQWSAITLDDPERWFADLAYGLSPLILGPVVVVLIVKHARKIGSAPASAG